jgi:4-hydroxybenzoate polyprenyltransferase
MGRAMPQATEIEGASPAEASSGVSFGRHIGGTLRLLHPFPSLVNAAAVLLFATLALGHTPAAALGTRLALTMLVAQFAIGITNDLADRDLDRATKSGKPLASGAVSPIVAGILLGVALLGAALGAASFGPASLATVALGTGLGLAYDLRLKRTALSWLPYLLALPLAPIWVWVALDRFGPRLLWLYPLGASLFLALHLANALADYTGDTAAGVRGLAQRLGREPAIRVLWCAAILPLALASALGLVLPYRWERLGPALALALLTILIAAALTRRQPRQEAPYRAVFGLLMVSTIILAVGWLGAIE